MTGARADGRAFTQLTRKGAERTLARIRRQLLTLDEDVARLYHGGAAELLGYGTGAAGWSALCDDLFADLAMLRPTPAARLERVLNLRRQEMSQRAIADTLDVSVGTINSDVRRLEDRGEQLPDNVVSLDEARRKATGPRKVEQPDEVVPVPPLPADLALTDLMLAALLHVHAQGQRGLTCAELELETEWGHGRASSLLHRLDAGGYVRRSGAFRGPHGAYVSVFTD